MFDGVLNTVICPTCKATVRSSTLRLDQMGNITCTGQGIHSACRMVPVRDEEDE